MAIYKSNGEIIYAGCVLNESSHMWTDGMEDVFVDVWDKDLNAIKTIKVGYYGADGCNLMGNHWEIDVTLDTARKVVRYLKSEACKAFADSVISYKNEIRYGSHVEVIKGRKIPKGTKLEVFWKGARPTYRSRMYDWMHETETIVGAWDASHNKVWIKEEYLKVIDVIQSPNAKNRKAFIKNWVAKEAHRYGIDVGF